MKWTLGIRNKWQVVLALIIALALMIAKNISENKSAASLEESFTSVYEDRLVVEAYIYRISSLVYENRLLQDNCPEAGSASDINDKIQSNITAINSIVAAFAQTKLTPEEALILRDLQTEIAAFNSHESHALNLSESSSDYDPFPSIAAKLNALSIIQLSEGKAMSENSQQTIASARILSTLEVAMLIVVAVLIQILAFSAKLSSVKPSAKIGLN